MRSTYTYAILEVHPEVYNHIRKLLADAGYDHAFHDRESNEVIDMHGIALKADPSIKSPREELTDIIEANSMKRDIRDL